MRNLIIILLLILSCAQLGAQDLSKDFKHWYITSLNFKLSKANTISVGQLTSFDAADYRNGFSMYRIDASHRFGKNWKGTLGYTYNIIKRSDGSSLPYSRIHLEAAHQVKWKRLRMRNSLRLEQFFPQLQKFNARAVITNKWWYYNRKWPLRLSPFVKNQVFYYQGGREVNYWLTDEEALEEGVNVIRQAPNGWHRYRLTLGVRTRLAPQLNLSLFYTLQREFNTGFVPYRALNIPNKSGTKTKLRFNNYSLFGISLNYTLKLYNHDKS